MEREKPRSRKKKSLGIKGWAAVLGGIAFILFFVGALQPTDGEAVSHCVFSEYDN